MGNQQGTLTDAEAGWLAGVIDGEGSITLNVRKKHWKGWQGVGVDLSIMLTNTDAGIIEKAVAIIEKLVGSQPYVYEGRTKELYRADGRAYHNELVKLLQLNVAKMGHIRAVLMAIEPHLAGEKRSRARLALAFIERRLSRKGPRTQNGPSWYDGYDWAIVQEFYQLKGKPLPPEIRGLLNEHEQDRLSALAE